MAGINAGALTMAMAKELGMALLLLAGALVVLEQVADSRPMGMLQGVMEGNSIRRKLPLSPLRGDILILSHHHLSTLVI